MVHRRTQSAGCNREVAGSGVCVQLKGGGCGEST